MNILAILDICCFIFGYIAKPDGSTLMHEDYIENKKTANDLFITGIILAILWIALDTFLK